MIRQSAGHLFLAACGLALATPLAAADQPAPTPQQIAQLEKTLCDSSLVGRFTVTGQEQGKPKTEQYDLGQVKHLGDGLWLLQARIRYGEHDVPIPLTLPIRWAGDTPVICVDDVTIPGLGTYTARVMIYRDHYAGYWTGGDHGGHLFGVIEHEEKRDADLVPGQ